MCIEEHNPNEKPLDVPKSEAKVWAVCWIAIEGVIFVPKVRVFYDEDVAQKVHDELLGNVTSIRDMQEIPVED